MSDYRSLPHNIEAERGLAGSCLGIQGAAMRLLSLVAPEDFFHPTLAAIMAAIFTLDATGKPIVPVTVTEQMRRDGTRAKLAAHGGDAFLYDLRPLPSAELEHFAEIVRGSADTRRLMVALTDLAERGYKGEDFGSYLAAAQQAIFTAARPPQKGPRSLSDVAAAGVQRLEEMGHGQALTGITTGSWELDQMTGGLQPGELVIIAARPSMGKTAFALGMAEEGARAGAPALIFSLEMSDEQIGQRAVSREARMDLSSMRRGLRGPALIRAREALRHLVLPIDVVDWGAPSLAEIRSEARRWRMRWLEWARREGRMEPQASIWIDYLQLVGGTGQPRRRGQEYNREREVAEISRGLKALAKELHVPVVALSQLNRGAESRPDKRPRTSDIRESGAVEQDADLICAIYRDEVYKKDSQDRGIAEIIILKQRNGPTGTVRLRFIEECVRFENLSPAPPPTQESLL